MDHTLKLIFNVFNGVLVVSDDCTGAFCVHHL